MYIYIYIMAKEKADFLLPFGVFVFVCLLRPPGAPQKPGLVAAAPASKTARWPARRPVAM